MSITEALNKTAGRFTTLAVRNKNNSVTNYCAQITSASPKVVSFYDVNSGRDRRVPTNSVSRVKSGSLSARAK